jgi:CheY-like chemotaxis protein
MPMLHEKPPYSEYQQRSSQAFGEERPVVLLIEADSSLRRLISLGLQHRGIDVIEASSPAHVPSSDIRLLNLLILDVDNGIQQDWSFLESSRLHPDLARLPMVLLAWDDQGKPTSSVATTMSMQVVYLTKPFDARVLHHEIEHLLALQVAEKQAAEARAEEALLYAYAKHAAPSVWPVVTAAGVLLAMIGMLLQVAVAVTGLLIVLVALLLWTLGTKTEAGAREVSVNVLQQ